MPIDTPLSPAYVLTLAETTDAEHRDGRTCPHCTDGGCEQLVWAREIIDANRIGAEAIAELRALWAG